MTANNIIDNGENYVREYLKAYNKENDILTFEDSTATVAEAAAALSCSEAQIAKTLSFYGNDNKIIFLVLCGDARVDNKKFKGLFSLKSKMLSFDDVSAKTPFKVGGVCPFFKQEEYPNIEVYIDDSLRRFDFVYPACGSDHSALKINVEELFKISHAKSFVDVAKI